MTPKYFGCFVTLIAMLFVTGCQTAGTESYTGPSGKMVHQTKCKISNVECFKKASSVCKGPYKVISSDTHAGGILADWIPGPITWYTMSYRCGEVDGKQPKFRWKGPKYTPPPPPAPAPVIINNPPATMPPPPMPMGPIIIQR